MPRMQTLPLSQGEESIGAAPLGYAAPARQSRRMRSARAVLLISYAALIFLPFAMIVLIGWLPPAAIVAMFYGYAFALLPTFYLDHWLFAGTGFHSPVAFALLALLTAAMLWPLPLLGIAPALWHARRWRCAILLYTAVFLLLACAAAWQMTRSWAMFFG